MWSQGTGGLTCQDPGSESFNCKGAMHLDAGHTQKNASSILTLGTDFKVKSASTVKRSTSLCQMNK